MQQAIALVTGAGGGLGHATARALLAVGYRVAFTYRRPSERSEDLGRVGADRARGYVFDLRETAAADYRIQTLIKQIVLSEPFLR